MMPQSMRMVVDLPAPFGRRKPKISPARTAKLIPSTAVKRPKRLTRSVTTTASASEGIVRQGLVGRADAVDHRLFEVRVAGAHLGRRGVGQDAAAVHQQQAVAALALVQVGGGDQDR